MNEGDHPDARMDDTVPGRVGRAPGRAGVAHRAAAESVELDGCLSLDGTLHAGPAGAPHAAGPDADLVLVPVARRAVAQARSSSRWPSAARFAGRATRTRDRCDAHPDRRRIEPSWQRMFDLDWNNRRYQGARAERSIQGVIWEIRPDDVVESASFVAR